MKKYQKTQFTQKTAKQKVLVSVVWFLLTILFLLIFQEKILPLDPELGVCTREDQWITIGLLVLTVLTLILNIARSVALTGQVDKAKYVRWWQFPCALLNLGLLVLEIETINNPILREMEAKYIVMNLVIWFFFAICLFLMLNCLDQTFLILNAAAALISLVFYFVYLFRGEAFILIDLFSIGTAAEVAAGYSYELTKLIVWWLAATMDLMALWMTNSRYRCSIRRLLARILLRLLAAELLLGGYYFYSEVSWASTFHVVSNLWNPEKTYQSYGTTLGSLAVARYMRLSEPDDYSVAKVQEVGEAMAELSDQPFRKDNAGGVTPVNLICVMNESWFDYRNIGSYATSEECMPYLDSVTDNIIKGYTLVCTKGGGTAKTEYEFLTGNSCKRFPGLVPYVCYYTHDQFSMVTALASQGYRTVAMHPNKATNWKRSSAYRFLQFDEFIDITDFDPHAQRYRNMMSDQANYEKIVETFEAKKAGEKLFLFDITMQNHSGYEHENFVSTVHLTDYASKQADEYFTLLRMSDAAIEYLLSYFARVEEPTMIVMFGDHSPKLPDDYETWLAGEKVDKLDLEQKEKFYETPFFIWTNYEMEAESDVLISTNYLSSYALSLTGIPLTDYNKYLLSMREEIPALNHLGYLAADGNWFTWEKGRAEELARENEYEILQYNNLIEKADRVDSMFAF